MIENSKTKNKSVFVTGIFRSGTTLLSRSLSVNPKIVVPYQIFFAFFKMWRNLFFERVVKNQTLSGYPMGSNALLDCGAFDEFCRSNSTINFTNSDVLKLQAVLSGQFERDSHEKPNMRSGLFDNIKSGTAEEILLQLIEKLPRIYGRDPEYLGFKEIWCEEFAFPLLNCKKIDIKVTMVIRDPRGVLASRNTGRYLRSCEEKKYPLIFVAEAWKRSVTIAKSLSPNKNFYMLKYEDLIDGPEKKLKDISVFLGVNFISQMADPRYFTDDKGNVWQPNTTTDDASCKFNKTPVSYWQKALSGEEVGAMEFLCAEQMRELKYRLKFERKKAEELFMGYHENEDEIQPWLVPFGYVCDEHRKDIELKKAKRGS